MGFWQYKMKFGKRTEQILRYASMLGMALAGLFFAFTFVACCIKGIREHIPGAIWFAVVLFGIFAVVAFYIFVNLWRESFSGSPHSVIVQLKAHDFRSLQFFNIAARYFQRRLRVIWVCSMFFAFISVISFLLCFISQVPWWFRMLLVASGSYGVYMCRNPYRLARHGNQLIEAARRLDQHHQLDCLEFMTTNLVTFRGDPVAVYILRLLRHEEPAA